MSVGLQKDDVFLVLDRLAKNKAIPDEVRDFIEKYTSQYGKAKIVLQGNHYFIEAVDKKTLKKLLKIEDVKNAYDLCLLKPKEDPK